MGTERNALTFRPALSTGVRSWR